MAAHSNSPHIPVLLTETLNFLDVQPNDVILDGTLGFGGHSSAILEKLGPNGRLFGCDQDPEAIAFCKKKFESDPRVHIQHGNFSEFPTLFPNIPFTKILVDLGYSSFQLDSANRGFSHQLDEPLDMRMNTNAKQTAGKILTNFTASELSDIFFHFGELHHNKRLVETICLMRKKEPFTTTSQLVYAVKQSFSFNNNRGLFMKTLAQVFQALRIATNKEWDHLTTFLTHLPTTLPQNGRAVFLTFHSGEDKLVKHFFKPLKPTIKPLTKHVVIASQDEIKLNSRSKPAKLRGYEVYSIFPA